MMRPILVSLSSLLAVLVASAALSAQVAQPSFKAIQAGVLFDGASEQILRNVTILIEGGRIIDVGPDVIAPVDAERIDLSDWTVLPGLIDLHTHLTTAPADFGADRGYHLYRYPEYPALLGAAHAYSTLLAGFTTVRDLGGRGTTALALRDAIAAGVVPGPRMITGIVLGTTGSHCDPTTGIRPGTADVDRYRSYVFDGPFGAEAAVRRAVRDGADVIKVCATAGVVSLTDDIGPAQMTPAELDAVVAAASMLNRSVAAHAHGAAGIRNAVRAGVTSIEHGSILDDDVIAEMKAHGTWLVPTMMAYESLMAMAEAGILPPGPTAKAFEVAPYVQESHRKAIEAGVPIAFGTDAGLFEHGENAREFQLMVSAGMTPTQVLLAATRNAAEALGRRDDLGTIERGRRADIIAVRDDPFRDIGVLQNVGFVMKEGVVYKRDGLPVH